MSKHHAGLRGTGWLNLSREIKVQTHTSRMMFNVLYAMVIQVVYIHLHNEVNPTNQPTSVGVDGKTNFVLP